MTRRLRWTEQAVDQLSAIAEYISRSSPVYAEALVDRIVSRLQVVLDYPDIGRRVPERDELTIRELGEWPYRLIYRRRGEAIEVLAIVHGRRDLRGVDLG